MNSYCALAILAVLTGAIAQDPPCSKQMELEKRCMLNVETSPEAQMIKDRMKQAFKTCAPDYPQECHAQFEAANECKISIAKDADNDPIFKESKAKSQPAIDECFEKFPADVKKGMMEIFMMDGKPGGPKFHKKWHHKKDRNDSSSAVSSEATSGEATSGEASAEVDDDSSSASNETSAERKHRGGGGRHHGGGGRHHGGGGKHHGGGGKHHGGGGRHHGGGGKHHGGGGKHHGGGGHGRHGRGGHGRHGHHGGHHGPRNFTWDDSSSSESNETSSSAASGEMMQKGGKSSSSSSGSAEWKGKGGMSGERSQCRKTEEQKQCIKNEMQKLGKDQAFVDVINTLVHQKQKCKQVISWSCSAKCPKQKKCVFKATKPCRQAFMERMKSCLQEKGFTLPPFMIKEHSSMFTTPVPDVEQ